MANIFEMVKQAGQLRKEMKRIESTLAEKRVEHSVNGGKIKVVARGDMKVESIVIHPELLAPDRVGKLQDLLVSAVNGALDDAKKKAGSEMSKLAGGLGLPNFPGL
jgi:nucleoid-associated protein EbfC